MWKDIEEFEGRYQINEIGQIQNVKSLRVLSPSVDCDGYLQIGLRKLGNRKKLWFRIHRLVVIAFNEKPENWKELQIDHIDRNKLNNSISNLRWVTSLENNGNRQETCWKTNLTGEIYITKYRNGYMVRINRSDLKHKSWHKTFEDAVKIRDSIRK